MARDNSGTVFDASVSFSHPIDECEEVIVKYFSKEGLKNQRILDAGCRTGDYSKAFLKLGALPYGADLSQSCIEKAKNELPELRENFFCEDICNLSVFPNGFFNIVFCIGVMPYLKDEEVFTAIQEFKRVTKNGGKILLVFQKQKSVLVLWLTKVLNRIPFEIYNSICIPILSILMLPLARTLTGRKVSYDFIRYGVFLSLRKIHFGVPAQLHPYIVETPNCGPVSSKMNVSVMITK